MENYLKMELKKFNEITLELVASLEKEAYDALDELFMKRQEIINSIDKLSYEQEEFVAICKELQIAELDAQLNGLMKEKKDKVRANMDSLAERKTANKSYSTKFAVDSIYFNKKY
jgi:hypothetical protein